MKLVTPQLIVKEDDGFTNDELDRKSYGEALLNIVVRSDDELVITLDGKWGEGKTTFVKMWQGLLSKEGIPNIYIDAFANDYIDDAFISIASAITAYAESHIKRKPHEQIDDLKDKAKKVGSQLLSWSARIGIKAATLGIIKDADIEELNEIKGDLSKSVSDVIGTFIEDRINSHSNDVALIQSFRDELSELPLKLQEDGEEKPLVVVVDELDRCKPTFAVEVIENIKHLFSVKNVVFVLVMNKKQLEESIRSVYGMEDAHTYLQKFINLETRLPKRAEESNKNDLSKYVRRLLKLHELETWGDENDIIVYLEHLANHFQLSLRQLEKVFTNLSVFYGTSAKNHYRNVPIIIFLAVVKVVDPQLFEALLQQGSSYKEVIKTLGLAEIDDKSERGRTLHFIMEWLRYALLGEDDFQGLPENDEIKSYGRYTRRYDVRRERLIPIFAQKLSMFVVS